MQFKVFSPLGILLNEKIKKLDFEAIDGFFTLLPKHIDFVDALTTSIVSYTNEEEKTAYIACDEGILVKKGQEVVLTTKLAILGSDLSKLTQTIETDFKQMREARKEANKTMAQLEINLTKGLLNAQRMSAMPEGM